MRRSHDKRRELGALRIVSVWSTEQGITLGKIATEEKSNEITAIPQLIDQIDVADAIITIDAAGCQKDIAEQIVDARGDYVLALKANHPILHDAVHDLFLDHLKDEFARISVSRFETEEKSHGRIEKRIYFQLTAREIFPAMKIGRVYERWVQPFGSILSTVLKRAMFVIIYRAYVAERSNSPARYGVIGVSKTRFTGV